MRAHRVRQYGIEVDEFRLLMDKQEMRCPVCRDDIDYFESHVDHDHVSGVVRGVLCGGCNLAIGHLRDRPEAALGAYRYLTDDQSS